MQNQRAYALYKTEAGNKGNKKTKAYKQSMSRKREERTVMVDTLAMFNPHHTVLHSCHLLVRPILLDQLQYAMFSSTSTSKL